MIRFETRKTSNYISFTASAHNTQIDEGLLNEEEATEQAKELLSTAYDLLPEQHHRKAKIIERIFNAL